jgi:hypothetical protein
MHCTRNDTVEEPDRDNPAPAARGHRAEWLGLPRPTRPFTQALGPQTRLFWD